MLLDAGGWQRAIWLRSLAALYTGSRDNYCLSGILDVIRVVKKILAQPALVVNSSGLGLLLDSFAF